MKKVKLTQNKYAIVDELDYEELMKYKWRYHNEGYAINGRNTLMHRLILKTPKGLDTDHINHNRLDNRRSNIRVCTRKENLQDMRRFHGGYHKRGNKFRVQIMRNGNRKTYGYYKTESQAKSAVKKIRLGLFNAIA